MIRRADPYRKCIRMPTEIKMNVWLILLGGGAWKGLGLISASGAHLVLEQLGVEAPEQHHAVVEEARAVGEELPTQDPEVSRSQTGRTSIG